MSVSRDVQLILGATTLTLTFSARAVMALRDRWKAANEREVMEQLRPVDGHGRYVGG